MKPISLATERAIAKPAVISGNHIIIVVVAAVVVTVVVVVVVVTVVVEALVAIALFMNCGININITAILEAKVMTNQGTTCTKPIVFEVARLLLFEVIPIHMPNQQIARRFALVVMAAAAAEINS